MMNRLKTLKFLIKMSKKEKNCKSQPPKSQM